MKTLIFFSAFAFLGISHQSRAQLTSNVTVTSGGASLISSSSYEGFATVGLPLVGTLDGGNFQGQLGLYALITPPPPKVNGAVAAPSSREVIGNLYPNPTSGTFTAQLPSDFGIPERIVFLDMPGKTVLDLTNEVTLNALNVSCKLPPLSDGAYFLRIESKKQVLVYKVILQQ